MKHGIPNGLTREHVLLALTDLDAGFEHPFRKQRDYDLVIGEKRYPPNAVVGIACRHLPGGEVLLPRFFSSGVGPGQAVYVLRQLGFNVVNVEEEPVDAAPKDWTDSEVALIVADYFDMLKRELAGQKVNKTEHRKALLPLLNGRSDGSIEFKHCNISAVLVRLELPYIAGYKPRFNFQAALVAAVEAYLDNHAGYLADLADSTGVSPSQPRHAPDPDTVFDEPPDQVETPEKSKPWISRRARLIDFVARDAANRKLGRLGEEFTVELERSRLRAVGRDDLARRVDWVADSVGDGLGFEVSSFDEEDESELLIEVKTTGLGKFHPFFVTDTEVRCSEDVPDRYLLYRVFEFSKEPRVFVLPGSLRESCSLEASQYQASAREGTAR